MTPVQSSAVAVSRDYLLRQLDTAWKLADYHLSGLTTEECERLFTPYYTTKQHGTGLGLAIVQSVVSDHGGRIGVISTPGEGTTFTIDLPLRRDS